MVRLHGVLLLSLVACGRLGFDDAAPVVPPPGMTAHETPQLCNTASWPTLAAAADDDLSIAVTPTHVAMLSVPKSGGALHGAFVDHAFAIASAGVVRTGPFTASAAAYVDDTLIAAVVSSSRVLVNIVPETGDTYTEIANVDGELVGKQALMHASADRITPTACSAGLTVNPFAGWTAATAKLTVTTAASTGLAAIPMDNEALAAWSTATECNVERIVDQANGAGSKQAWECRAPRLAYTGTSATMLFEADDGVHLASIDGDQLSATSLVAVAGASAPRLLYDGTRTWAAYLASDGELQVGTFDDTGALVTVDAGLAPGHDAFELALVDGALWAFAIDGDHYAAANICLR